MQRSNVRGKVSSPSALKCQSCIINYYYLFSEKSQAGRFRCSITVLDKGIKIIAEANNAKTVKAAAARAALTKLNTHS